MDRLSVWQVKCGYTFAPIPTAPHRLCMGSTNTIAINLALMAETLKLRLEQVAAVVDLLDAGNTVPFITRYRKDQTGGLDEEQIRQIQARLTKLRLLSERKQTILRSI